MELNCKHIDRQEFIEANCSVYLGQLCIYLNDTINLHTDQPSGLSHRSNQPLSCSIEKIVVKRILLTEHHALALVALNIHISICAIIVIINIASS